MVSKGFTGIIFGLCIAEGIPSALAKVSTPLGIPANMATLEEGYIPANQQAIPQYILIKDMHSQPEIQGKIAALVLYAHHHWKCRRVFVEGAFGEVGPPPFPIFTPERGERSANELLQSGRLSGAELAAALISHSPERKPVPFTIMGIDDRVLYLRQITIFRELSERRPLTLKHLRGSRLSHRQKAIAARLLWLRFTPRDYRVYLNQKQRPFSDPVLTKSLALAEDYYRLTELRSRRFVEKIPVERESGPTVIIVGGFHVAKMTQLFRTRHKSFIVLNPKVTQPLRQDYYESSLALSYDRTHQIPTNCAYSAPLMTLALSLHHGRVLHKI